MSNTYPDYYIGVDLGQQADFTALCVIEEPAWIGSDLQRFALNAPHAGWVAPDLLTATQLWEARVAAAAAHRPDRPPLTVAHLERFPLHTSYPAIVDAVCDRLESRPLAGRTVELVIDATGVGRAVLDVFHQRQLWPRAVTITGGNAVTVDGREYHVPKVELVSTVAVLLEQRLLTIANGLPDADVLLRELLAFERRQTPATGHEQLAAWREGTHDDLVLSVALAAWFRGRFVAAWDRAVANVKRAQSPPPQRPAPAWWPTGRPHPA